MPYPINKWDLVPVYGVFMTAPGDTPVQGSVEFSLSQRVTRTDGRTIYPDGARVKVVIGNADDQDATIRAQVRTAWRAADQAAQGVGFDAAAWDIWWDTKVLPAAIFTGFPAADDPDISQRGWTVTVKEALTGATGRQYAVQPLLAQLETPIPGINLGMVEVPHGSPTVPAPVYAKGVAGGIAALDADGDVVDALGEKVSGGLPEDATLADLAESATVKYFTSSEKSKLSGVATGATANDTDSNLKSRANHTGTQAISTVTSLQTTLDAKAPTASPTFTGTVSGVTKAHVGLGSVDNTSDLAKPVSTATQTALDAKAALSHSHTTANVTGLDTALSAKAPLASPAFTGTPTGITKTHVGLGNVDNTADANKPVSTAQAAAIATKLTGAVYNTVGDLPATGVAGVLYVVKPS